MSDEALPEPDRIDGAPHPRATAELFGQNQAEAAFLEAFNDNRMHHAWLIGGPRGIGKATLAWRIARFMLTQDAGELFGAPVDLSTPANHPVSHRMAAMSEPGLFLCRRPWDPKTKRLKTAITVDEVRKLKNFFTLSAADGGWRVAIVDAADEMNGAAANALLKILEEPPAKALILLVAHQPSRLLPTIRSRCRMLRCAALGPDKLTSALHQAGFDGGNMTALAELSMGSPGEAIRLMASNGVETYGQIINLIGMAPRMDRTAIIALGEKCAARGNEAQYDMVLRLIMLALTRLARFGAGAGMVAAVDGETDIARRLAPAVWHSRIWADLHAELDGRIAHARAVNLDPAQVILDTCLRIETAARRGAA